MQRISVEQGQRAGASTTIRQHIAPSAIRGLEVLTLPIASLETYIHDAVEQNPLLELDYSLSSVEFTGIEVPCIADEADERDDGPDIDVWADACVPMPVRSTAEHEAFDFERMGSGIDEMSTLCTYLRLQGSMLRLDDPAEDRLLESIIVSIDEDGYLSESLPVLCHRAGCDISQGEKVLAAVQTFDPRGVAARDLAECLLLQIDAEDPDREVLADMFTSSMQDLAYNRSTKLARRYSLSRERLTSLQEKIRSLDPRPGASFARHEDVVYVVPDIRILGDGTRFTVDVTGEIGETLTLNAEYLAMMGDGMSDSAARSWLEGRRADADQVIRNISERKRTLYRLGRFILENQYDFFCYGENRLKPLTMQHAAEVLDLHVSTISRAVQDKSILTPWGVYPARFFFCNSVPCNRSGSRGAVSSLVIKKRIEEIIAGEDVHDPLSDAAITEILNGEGVEIRRRTIAKYREALGLEKQSQRRH